MARTVSIAEVASAAGVGVGTVSRVLSGSTRVSETTRAKVLAVMADLDYRPSRLAAGLSTGRTNLVAVLVPFLTRPSVVARLAGVLAELQGTGLDGVVCDIETADQRDRHLASFSVRHSVDGVVVVSLPLPRARLRRLAELRMPLVAVDVDVPGVPRVVIDDVAGGRMATEHLLSLGHRRIAFLGDAPDRAMGFTSTARRLDGYLQALAAAGVPPDPQLILKGPHGVDSASEMARSLLRLPDPPTAIFAASDTQAVGVIRSAQAAGVAVPDGVSVMGFDDIETAELLGLTTVRQPLRQSGVQGARLLCGLLAGAKASPTRQVLPLEIVIRQSTGPPQARARAPARRVRAPTGAPRGRREPAGSPN